MNEGMDEECDKGSWDGVAESNVATSTLTHDAHTQHISIIRSPDTKQTTPTGRDTLLANHERLLVAEPLYS